MEANDQMKLETLKASIGSRAYEVDVDAVADAIVRRLLGGVQAVTGGDRPAGPGAPAPSS